MRDHARPWQEVARELEVQPEVGLSQAEVESRQARFGGNELPSKPPRPLVRQLIDQFRDATVLALVAAAIIALILAAFDDQADSLLERYGDAFAIIAIVCLNAILGLWQERKAEAALAALQSMTAPTARVLREGREVTIAARDLVPGDVLVLRTGDRVTADARLTLGQDLQVTEAALTGESLPVRKEADALCEEQTPLAERTNLVFGGTHVVGGKGQALVVGTGVSTELGNIAMLLSSVEEGPTPLQRALTQFGSRIVIGCGVMGILVFLLGWIRLHESLGFLFLTAVSLAVAAIPEGLPAITTIVLALGMQAMAKRQALVRRLSAVEALGVADVICTDKTGTITQNRMDARRVWLPAEQRELTPDELGRVSGPSRDVAREILLLCHLVAEGSTDAEGQAVVASPTDDALHRMAKAMPQELAQEVELSSVRRVRELPFDGDRKLASTVVQRGEASRLLAHGAAERILELSTDMLRDTATKLPLDAGVQARIEAQIASWAAQGFRILGLAVRDLGVNAKSGQSSDLEGRAASDLEQGLTLIGLVALADPPRAEVAPAVAKARSAGVRTIMITGDHPLTAQAIAREVGITRETANTVTGSEVDAWGEEELRARVSELNVVARATAGTKLKLVQALAHRGHVVAMTGDGVNDAPAIKASAIGVAMGRGGTDVAREAADIVLADDNYATIVAAIEEGRIIYANIQRFIEFLFAANVGLVLAVFGSLLFGWPALLTPTQILWINLITNGLPALALGMEPVHENPMNRPPRSSKDPIMGSKAFVRVALYGAFMAALGLVGFWYYLDRDNGDPNVARSVAFTVLALGPMFHSLNARSHLRSVFSLGFFSNWRLLGAFAMAFLLQASALYLRVLETMFATVALPLSILINCLALASSVWVVGELGKLLVRVVRQRQPLES